MDRFYTATELAEQFGITVRALHFYESKGLICPSRAGTTRVYTHRDRGRLELILRGKRLGFSLAEIKEYLSLYHVDTDHIEQLLLLRRKVTERIEALRLQKAALEETLSELREIEAQVAAALAEKDVAGDPARGLASDETHCPKRIRE